jgi:hypothetical protein
MNQHDRLQADANGMAASPARRAASTVRFRNCADTVVAARSETVHHPGVDFFQGGVMTPRIATVVLRNETGFPCNFQVLHQYTGDAVEQTDFVLLQPGEQRQVLTVHSHTGFFTTGVDNWIVNGIEPREVEELSRLPPGLASINLGGKAYVDLRWRSGEGFGSDWKVHTLRSEDENSDIVIVVFPTTVELRSASGTSSTGWHPEYDIDPHSDRMRVDPRRPQP